MDFIKRLEVETADHRRKTGRPFVTLSYAQSLDGCISSQPGQALALSGRKSLVLTHTLRSIHEAILVGIGTVFADNPRLNVRLVDGSSPRPIVVDTRLRIPPDCRLLTDNPRRPWVITGPHHGQDSRKSLEALGAVVMPMPCDSDGLVDLGAMLSRLGELGVNSLMVEGGASIITNFLMRRLADFMVVTVAPVILNGLRGVRDLRSNGARDCLRLKDLGHKRLGDDVILWGNLSAS